MILRSIKNNKSIHLERKDILPPAHHNYNSVHKRSLESREKSVREKEKER